MTSSLVRCSNREVVSRSVMSLENVHLLSTPESLISFCNVWKNSPPARHQNDLDSTNGANQIGTLGSSDKPFHHDSFPAGFTPSSGSTNLPTTASTGPKQDSPVTELHNKIQIQLHRWGAKPEFFRHKQVALRRLLLDPDWMIFARNDPKIVNGLYRCLSRLRVFGSYEDARRVKQDEAALFSDLSDASMDRDLSMDGAGSGDEIPTRSYHMARSKLSDAHPNAENIVNTVMKTNMKQEVLAHGSRKGKNVVHQTNLHVRGVHPAKSMGKNRRSIQILLPPNDIVSLIGFMAKFGLEQGRILRELALGLDCDILDAKQRVSLLEALAQLPTLGPRMRLFVRALLKDMEFSLRDESRILQALAKLNTFPQVFFRDEKRKLFQNRNLQFSMSVGQEGMDEVEDTLRPKNAVFILQAFGRLRIRPSAPVLEKLLDIVHDHRLGMTYSAVVAYEMFRLDVWDKRIFEHVILDAVDVMNSQKQVESKIDAENDEIPENTPQKSCQKSLRKARLLGIKDAANLLLSMAYFSLEHPAFIQNVFREVQRGLTIPHAEVLDPNSDTKLDTNNFIGRNKPHAALSQLKIIEIALRTKFWRQEVSSLTWVWLRKIRHCAMPPEKYEAFSDFQSDIARQLAYVVADFESEVMVGPYRLDFVLPSGTIFVKHIAIEAQGPQHYYRSIGSSTTEEPFKPKDLAGDLFLANDDSLAMIKETESGIATARNNKTGNTRLENPLHVTKKDGKGTRNGRNGTKIVSKKEAHAEMWDNMVEKNAQYASVPITQDVEATMHEYLGQPMTATSKLKHVLLERLGYAVIHINTAEWSQLRSNLEKQRFLRRRINARRNQEKEWEV